MFTILLWLLGVAAFIVVLLASIGLHEAGHMVAARWCGLHVPKFFIGFGRTIWSFKRGGTEYGLKAIPLGGFVSIEDPTRPEGEDDRMLLSHVHPLKRILVFIAGPLVNLALAVVILMAGLVGQPYRATTTTVQDVTVCEHTDAEHTQLVAPCGAYAAGIFKGDTITSVNGRRVSTLAQVRQALQEVPDGQKVPVTVHRVFPNGGGERDFNKMARVEGGTIGLTVKTETRRLGVAESAKVLGAVSVQQVQAIPSLVGQIPAVWRNIIGQGDGKPAATSIIAVGKTYGDVAANTGPTASSGFSEVGRVRTLVLFSGLVNLSLFVMNALLPMLPLDSGRILIALVDLVRMGWARFTRVVSRGMCAMRGRLDAGCDGCGGWVYRPLSSKIVNTLTVVTSVPLFLFFIMLVVSDVMSTIRGSI